MSLISCQLVHLVLCYGDFSITFGMLLVEDQEGEAGKIFLNTTSANPLCTSLTLGLHGNPGINYQQYGPFFPIEVHHLCTAISTSSHRQENTL